MFRSRRSALVKKLWITRLSVVRVAASSDGEVCDEDKGSTEARGHELPIVSTAGSLDSNRREEEEVRTKTRLLAFLERLTVWSDSHLNFRLFL